MGIVELGVNDYLYQFSLWQARVADFTLSFDDGLREILIKVYRN